MQSGLTSLDVNWPSRTRLSSQLIPFVSAMHWFELIVVMIFCGCLIETGDGGTCVKVPVTFLETQISVCVDLYTCRPFTVNGCINNNTDGVVSIKVKSNVWKLGNGAVQNLPSLEIIDMSGIKLEEVDPGAFKNLTSLRKLLISGNFLKKVRAGAFSNTTIRMLDLSFNIIKDVEDFAFASMPNLFALYLGNNFIDKVTKNWFRDTINIGTIDLSDNKLTALNSDFFWDMTRISHVNLNFNMLSDIEDLGIRSRKLSVLNLSGNQLTDLSFLKYYTINILQIGFNRISYIDGRVMRSVSVGLMYVHPNPWQCVCLRDFWADSKKQLPKENSPEDDTNIEAWGSHIPICIEKRRKADVCTFSKDEEFEEVQKEYFQAVNYDDIRKRNTSLTLTSLYSTSYNT